MNKICFSCNIEKDSELFSRDKSKHDGLAGRCKECRKTFNSKNQDKIKLYLENNKDSLKKYTTIHNNKPEVKIYKKIYAGKIENRIRKNKRNQERYKNDIEFKLQVLLRTGINRTLKNQNAIKSNRMISFLSCTIPEFKQHLELLFLPEMNWLNYGTIWEIDHIKSCASFDLTDPKQQEECFHYTNMRPLFITTEIAELFEYNNYIGNRNRSKITNEFKK